MISYHYNRFLVSSLLLLSTHTYAATPNTVVATMATGINPAGLAITLDNRFAYVANNNNYGLMEEDSVTVLKLKDNTVKTTIFHSSFNQPYTITINPAGTRAYVTNSNSTTIAIIDIHTNTVIGVIDGFDGPSGMVITPDGTKAYVNNYGGPDGVGSGNGTTVRLVDLNTNTIVGSPITVGLAPAALAITPNGKYVYVANYVDGNTNTGTITVIKTDLNNVVNTISGFSGPFAIVITPDGKYAYVTNFGSNNFEPIGTTVSVVKLKTGMIVETFEVGIQPSGIAITPNCRYVYVSNYNTLYAGSNFTDLTAGQGTVNIIDTKKHEVIAPTIVVGQSPANIAIAPNGKHAYVTNYTSNTVSVIALPHNC
jgi:YVTN family beta-propeller protein